MRSLARAVTHDEMAAPTLPNMYDSLTNKQIAIRKGEVSMIAGQPGAGKSTLALALALRAQVPTVYFSADSHAHTMSLRTIAALTGTDQALVEATMQEDPLWASEVLEQSNHIRWSFESAPSLRDVELEIEAHRELMGTDPELVVFDNLIDASYDSGDEWGSLRSLLREFKWWARDTGAAFLVLHHSSEGVTGNPCPPRSSLHGKVAQTPALILTVTGEQRGFMGVAAVKNRYGPANASGSDPVWLLYDPATMQINDMEVR